MSPNKIALVSVLIAATLVAGCSSASVTRGATDLGAAGLGAVVAHKVSDGNPYWTAAGAVVGIAAAEAVQSKKAEAEKERLAVAFDRGRSQLAQQTYDAIQNAQKTGGTEKEAAKQTNTEDGYVEIPITAPRRVINGVVVNPSVEYVKISTQ